MLIIPSHPTVPQIRITNENEEKDIFFSDLVSKKPWLACIPAKSIKLANLKRQFKADDVAALTPEETKAFRDEVLYI